MHGTKMPRLRHYSEKGVFYSELRATTTTVESATMAKETDGPPTAKDFLSTGEEVGDVVVLPVVVGKGVLESQSGPRPEVEVQNLFHSEHWDISGMSKQSFEYVVKREQSEIPVERSGSGHVEQSVMPGISLQIESMREEMI